MNGGAKNMDVRRLPQGLHSGPIGCFALRLLDPTPMFFAAEHISAAKFQIMRIVGPDLACDLIQLQRKPMWLPLEHGDTGENDTNGVPP